MDIAEYMTENQLPQISFQEVNEFFQEYLDQRNLGIELKQIVEVMCQRCPIIIADKGKNTFQFKHRTFAEFLFAKKAYEQRSKNFPQRNLSANAFHPYWTTPLYFYVGLQRDCPALLNEIIDLVPDNEGKELIKVLTTADLLLAAYSTPYKIITRGVATAALDLAKMHARIVSGGSTFGLDQLPPIQLLAVLQYIFSRRYAYKFLLQAIPEAVLDILMSSETREIKAYAIFFLSHAYKELDGKDSFDFLLTDELKPLPFPIEVFMTVAAKDLETKSKALRKHLKHVMEGIRANGKLKAQLAYLFERPVHTIGAPPKKGNKK